MIDFKQLENQHWYIQTHKTQDEDKQNKTHHDTGNQNDEQYGLHKKPEVNPGPRKR
jgi:hypothetical protein